MEHYFLISHTLYNISMVVMPAIVSIAMQHYCKV